MSVRDNAPFYQFGPSQFTPPEAHVDAEERVRLLRKEFGYSRVQLASGLTGYMANEDLVPAPPLPPPTPEPERQRRYALSGRGSNYVGPVVEVELPDMEEPPIDAPDINAALDSDLETPPLSQDETAAAPPENPDGAPAVESNDEPTASEVDGTAADE